MDRKYKILVASLLIVAQMMFVGCRDVGDIVLPDCSDKSKNYAESNSSLAGQFKAIWTVLNGSYHMWDYEEEKFGLDWDSVYRKYLPIFEKYDRRYVQEGIAITEEELWDLYKEIVGPLHDGHFDLKLRNLQYMAETIDISPQLTRVVSRKDYVYVGSVNHTFYLQSSEPEYQIVESDKGKDDEFMRFQDNILYYRTPSTLYYTDNEHQEQLVIWGKWFKAVQKTHKSGQLKGIIIDLRNCGGGENPSYQYVLGALQEPSTASVLDNLEYREKIGIGRHDYSPRYKSDFYTLYPGEREYITEKPIVILTGNGTRSLAEIICLVGKSEKLPNVFLLGTTTFGAISALLDEKDYPSFSLSGLLSSKQDFKDEKCSFYISMPTFTFFFEGKIYEGIGVTPDIEVKYDVRLYIREHRDNQLERALEYIRTGK